MISKSSPVTRPSTTTDGLPPPKYMQDPFFGSICTLTSGGGVDTLKKADLALSFDVEHEAADVPCIFGSARLLNTDGGAKGYARSTLKILLCRFRRRAANQADQANGAQHQASLQGGLQPSEARRQRDRFPPFTRIQNVRYRAGPQTGLDGEFREWSAPALSDPSRTQPALLRLETASRLPDAPTDQRAPRPVSLTANRE